jgi:hypothetical protein
VANIKKISRLAIACSVEFTCRSEVAGQSQSRWGFTEGALTCPGVNDSGLREASQPRVSDPGRLLPLLCGALSAVRPHGVTGAEARKHHAFLTTQVLYMKRHVGAL